MSNVQNASNRTLLVGTVLDVVAQGPGRTEVCLRTADGRNLSLVTDGSPVVDAVMRGAMAHGDTLRVGVDRIAPRLGAPYGTVASASVLDYIADVPEAV